MQPHNFIEPFCNETCNGEGTMCNETDDCVCKDNFENIEGICTMGIASNMILYNVSFNLFISCSAVCPDCALHATCYRPDIGCVCDEGYTGNETVCVGKLKGK